MWLLAVKRLTDFYSLQNKEPELPSMNNVRSSLNVSISCIHHLVILIDAQDLRIQRSMFC